MQTREFEITEDLYFRWNPYRNADITRMNLVHLLMQQMVMIMTYYELDQATDVAGLEIMLDSYAYETPLSAAGGEVVIFYDTADVNAEHLILVLQLESDFYMVSQTDIDNGYLQLELTINHFSGCYYVC